MLDPPSATAVAVGIAISSTSLDRTRQLRSIRPRPVRAGCSSWPASAWPPAPAPGIGSSAGPGRSVAGRAAGRPKAA